MRAELRPGAARTHGRARGRRSQSSFLECADHLKPQASGYGFDALGTGRLDFVGLVEKFAEHWGTLLRRLGVRVDGAKAGARLPLPCPLECRGNWRKSDDAQVRRRCAHTATNCVGAENVKRQRRVGEELKHSRPEWAKLAAEPEVQDHVRWDRRCLYDRAAAMPSTRRIG